MQRWEYYTTFLFANTKGMEDKLKAMFPNQSKFDKYALESLMPQLDHFGWNGWELMSMQPVYAGKNSDIALAWGDAPRTVWTNAYLCVFKRPVEMQESPDSE